MTGIFLHATVVTDTEITAWKVDPGEENYPTAPARIQTHDLSIMSLVL